MALGNPSAGSGISMTGRTTPISTNTIRRFYSADTGQELTPEQIQSVMDSNNGQGLEQMLAQGAIREGTPNVVTHGGSNGWPSQGLGQVSGGGQVSGQRLMPTLGAPRFTSPQTEAGMMPSERDIYQSEIQNQGFYLPDYLEQQRKQFGGFAGSSAGGLGRSGRVGLGARTIR